MELIFLIILGLVAGILGGLLGIGGSVIMIPALLFFMPDTSIYLAQATAMTVNPAVAISAAAKHHRNFNVSWKTVWMVLPISVVLISVAAWFSNDIKGDWLEFAFGLFLLWVLWNQLTSLSKCSDCKIEPQPKPTPTKWDPNLNSLSRCSATGGITGIISGLLGIGGGLIQVPLLNTLCKLPIKKAIGTSSAIMFVTAVAGATFKDISLEHATGEAGKAAITALQIIPGALIGGWLGAKLTRVMPTSIIRVAFAILVVIAACKLFAGSIPNLEI